MANFIERRGRAQAASTFADDFRKGKYLFHKFAQTPLILQKSSTVDAVPTAAQGQTDYMVFPGPNSFGMEMYQTTAQTLLPSIDGTDGLKISCDLVGDESVEYVPGGNTALSPFARTVGTDSNGFRFRCKVEITTVLGTDEFCIGLRKQEAFAVPTSIVADPVYTDMAVLVADSGDVKVATDLNNSGTATVTDTGFNWANGETHELEIRLAKGGVAQFFINGVELGGTVSKDGNGTAITAQSTVPPAQFTFDSGDVLIPFIFVRHDLTDGTAIFLKEIEIGALVPEV